MLAARDGMAAVVRAIVGWLDDPEPGLEERLDLAAHELKALLAERER